MKSRQNDVNKILIYYLFQKMTSSNLKSACTHRIFVLYISATYLEKKRQK